MKEKKRTKLWTSIASVLMCFAMLIGTTWAWFSETVSTSVNLIVAGNLDVELEWSTDYNTWNTVNEETNLFREDARWEPGRTEVVYLRICNVGTLDMRVAVSLMMVEETKGVNMMGETFSLSDHIYYDVVEVTEAYADRESVKSAMSMTTTVSDTYRNNDILLYDQGETEKESTKTYALLTYMPEDTDNAANYRGAVPTIKLGLEVLATQLVSESDAFDNTYDNDAEYPESTLVPMPREGLAYIEVKNTSGDKVLGYKVAGVGEWIGKDLVIPETHNGLPIYGIESNAFKGNTQIETVTIPEIYFWNGIGQSAFENCTSLTSVKLPSTLKTMGVYAFKGCTALKEVDMSKTKITYLNDYGFANCTSLTNIKLPEGLTGIGTYVFSRCSSLETIKFPSTLKKVYSSAFYVCENLKEVDLSDTVVTDIGSHAFAFCDNLQTVKLPGTVESIDRMAFRDTTAMVNFKFDGATTAWGKINLGTDWNYSMPVTSVECSDGWVTFQ